MDVLSAGRNQGNLYGAQPLKERSDLCLEDGPLPATHIQMAVEAALIGEDDEGVSLPVQLLQPARDLGEEELPVVLMVSKPFLSLGLYQRVILYKM